MLTVDIAGASRPRPDQAVGGDLTFIKHQQSDIWVACVDVLGHGPQANGVAKKMAVYFDDLKQFKLPDVLNELNSLLQGGRGAAVSLCRLVPSEQHMEFVGIGNVAVRKFHPHSQSLVNRDGVVGEQLREPSVQRIPLQPGDIFLLHTDGVQNRFALPQYRHIISDSATRAVSHILQNFAKNHDDAGCIVIKVKS